jgi:catechol 2,3-dioxygenase-like lactoylglutathione lyase family enzyme
MIEGISAVTLGTHDMPRAVRFYRALGFELLHGNEEGGLTGVRAGSGYPSSLSLPNGAGPGGAALFSRSPMSMQFTN